MKIITFSGLDGSGKSTQLALLREKLERENWNVAYFHAVEFSLANRITRFFKGQKSFASGKEKALTHASGLTIFLRKIFLFIDLIRFRYYIARLKKENCDYLLSDRYFYDSIINIRYLASARKQQISNGYPLSFISHLLFIPDMAFYMDVSPETIMSRKRPPEQGIEYLRAKTELFKQKILDWNFIVIDANQNKENVFRIITEYLNTAI